MGIFAVTKRPDNLGVTSGKLTPCSSASNCVSSQATGKHYIEPFPVGIEPVVYWENLRNGLAATTGMKLLEATDTYMHFECTTPLLGFVDDLELYLDAEIGVCHVRSASRFGYFDFGKNRQRVESIRKKWL